MRYMAIDLKDTIKRLKGDDTDRGNVNLYLNKKIFEEFKQACGDISASKVIDDLIAQALDSLKNPKKINPDLLDLLEILGEKAQLEILKNLRAEQKADEIEKAKSREYRRKG